jgi:murein DD-endopeptidase MepM/ murein hydrolase activator NlpD
MKRATLIVAAFLLLPFTFAPQPPAAYGQNTATVQTAVLPSHMDLTADLPSHTRAAEQRYVVVAAGDTYGKWATARCGNFSAWPAIQAANKWPERRIPVGATAIIVCGPVTTPPPAAKPATTTSTGTAWVHPLTSGARGTSCYRTSSRPSHNGIDLPAWSGTPIRAASAGTVTVKAYQASGAGHFITLKHANGIYTRYHHLQQASALAIGATVQAGQTIGYVGATGNATGPHLHFEVMQGGTSNSSHLNPAGFMRDRAVNIGC